MKKLSKRFLALGLSLAMVISMAPSTQASASENSKNAKATKSDIAEAAEELGDAVEDAQSSDVYGYVGTASESGEADKASEAKSYPSECDLTDGHITGFTDARNVMTPVKFQNPFGSCWGFAAIAAAEGSIISEYVNDYGEDLDTVRDNMDLSEKHLAWFAYGKIEDKDNSQYGEGFCHNDSMKDADIYGVGAYNLQLATNLFASGVGPLAESADVDDGDNENLFKYMGANGEKYYEKVYDEESEEYKKTPLWYSEDDDWSIPYKYRYYQTYDLEESYILPGTNGAGSASGKYEYNEAGTNAVKDQLLQGRPVEVTFYADSSEPSSTITQGKYINLKTWAHYTYQEGTGSNHAVTIVGYDDNYSKSNFIEGHQPPADGAFLVKNSWGATESEFPNKGNGWGISVNGKSTGYFWLSYYDKSISGLEALNFELSDTTENGYFIDQYDYAQEIYPTNKSYKKQAKSCNVFTAEVTERLFAVGCQTSTPNTKVTYDVYVLSGESETPDEGYKIASKQETYEYGGYHKCMLDDGVVVQKGQKYAIVVTQLQPNGKYAVFMNAVSTDKDPDNKNSWFHAVVNKGESFLYKNSEWIDFKSVAKQMNAEDDEIEVDNFPIKGYAVKCSDAKICSDDTYLCLAKAGYKDSLTTYFRGDLPDGTDDSITWSSSDESVVTVEPYKNDKGKVNDAEGVITAKGTGVAYIFATNKYAGTVMFKIFVGVTKPKIISAKSGSNGIKVTWKFSHAPGWYKIKYTVAGKKSKTKYIDVDDNNKTNPTFQIKKPNKHAVYKFEITAYTSDDNDNDIKSSTATVYVNQKPAATKIKSLTAKKGGFTVKWKKQSSTGYQIKYSTSKSMKNAKTIKITKNTKVSKVIKGLKKGKKYYVKVRTYNKTPDSVRYSKWSAKKVVKTKK